MEDIDVRKTEARNKLEQEAKEATRIQILPGKRDQSTRVYFKGYTYHQDLRPRKNGHLPKIVR